MRLQDSLYPTHDINRHKSTTFCGAGLYRPYTPGMKVSGAKSDVDTVYVDGRRRNNSGRLSEFTVVVHPLVER